MTTTLHDSKVAATLERMYAAAEAQFRGRRPHNIDLSRLERGSAQEGDALDTLADVNRPVGVALLDGWKEMYLPVLDVLEPKLEIGSLVVADNTERADTKPYLDRVRDPANGYTSVNFPAKRHDTMELSCRVG